jgi:hypothetical protein
MIDEPLHALFIRYFLPPTHYNILNIKINDKPDSLYASAIFRKCSDCCKQVISGIYLGFVAHCNILIFYDFFCFGFVKRFQISFAAREYSRLPRKFPSNTQLQEKNLDIAILI